MKFILILLLSLSVISCVKKDVKGKITGRIMMSCGSPAVNTTFSLFKQKESAYQAYQYIKVKDFQTDSLGYFDVDYQTKDVRTLIVSMDIGDDYLPFNNLIFDVPAGQAIHVGDLYYKNQVLDCILKLKTNKSYSSSDTLYIQSFNLFPTYKLAGPFTDNFMDTLLIDVFTPSRKYNGQSDFTVNVTLNSTPLMTDKKVIVKDYCPLVSPYTNNRFLQVNLP